MPVVRSLQLPGLRVEYDRVRGQADGYAVTRRGALGVAFTGQEIVAVSPLHFAKRFKATTGIAPHAYIIARRMDLAMDLLCASRLSIAQLAARVGYANPAHFRAQFRTHWGRSPGSCDTRADLA